MKKNDTENGFTLVELAIVLMIIGLLIGGVLRGQELLQNSRVTAVVQQVKAYQGAYVTFMDSYYQMPGDMTVATRRIPGCTAANFCVDGDGNQVIGELVLSAVKRNQTGTAVPQVETSMFWKHLSMARLISGVVPSANPATPEAGQTHPDSRLGGAFVVASKSTGEPDSFQSGPVLKLQQAPADLGYAVSPMMAYRIDAKMDDGRPNSGYVAAEIVGSGCKTNDTPTGVYSADTNDTPRCVMYFKL